MEKTTTKTIVKAKQQLLHHGGSKSAAAEVITVENPEVLSCPKCLHPLKSPVFQCASGHLVCSSCHDDLPDKTKCASCFISTGHTRFFIPTAYSRCHGVERILRSVRVACPNTIYGCTAGKMLFHEKAEHEKICASKAVAGELPRWVVKMGPCGGGGGDGREMDVRGVSRISKVVVWHRAAVSVDAMWVVYEQDGVEQQTEQWGRPGLANISEVYLAPDEYLTSVKGHLGDCNGRFCVRSLTFVGNGRTFGPYGREEGSPFELPASGGRIVGFHGRFSYYMDALGTYVKMDA